MSILMLEVFDNLQNSANSTIVSAELETFEAEKTAAYERGYQEGLCEGQGRLAIDSERIRATLAAFQEHQGKAVHDLRQELLQALEPLLEGLVGSVLPMAARASLVPLAVEAILDMTSGALPNHFSIAVSAEEFDLFSAHFNIEETSDFEIVQSDALIAGQYGLRFDDREGLLDIPRLQKELLNLIRAFFSLDDTRGQHG